MLEDQAKDTRLLLKSRCSEAVLSLILSKPTVQTQDGRDAVLYRRRFVPELLMSLASSQCAFPAAQQQGACFVCAGVDNAV